MNIMSRKEVEDLRRRYPKGTRIKLIRMEDPYRNIPEGTKGTVDAVDDVGTIHVRWDDGSRLGIVPGVDEFRKVLRVSDTMREIPINDDSGEEAGNG